MKKNIGRIDRLLRVAVAFIAFALGYYYQSWWGLLGFIPLLTGFFLHCPLYTLFGISTCKKT